MPFVRLIYHVILTCREGLALQRLKLGSIVLIVFVVLIVFAPGEVFAGSYEIKWLIYSKEDQQQRSFANILVKYSAPDNARGSFDVDTSLTYVNDAQARLDWIEFYDVAVRLRNAPKGNDLASSAIDSSHNRLRAGQQYTHRFTVGSPTQAGQYLVILTWKTINAEGSAYGLSISGGEITWDTGNDSDPGRIPRVITKSVPVLIIKVEPKGDITGNVKIDGQSLLIVNGQVQIDLIPGQHSIEVPAQLDLGTGKRAVFQDWSDADKSNPKQVSSETDLVLIAFYKIQYLLTIVSDKGGPQGTGWYDSGSRATFSVSSSTGFLIGDVFDHWEGDYSGSSPSGTVTMDGPETVRAVWRTDYTQLLIIGAVIVIVVVAVAFFARRRGAPAVQPARIEGPRVREVRMPPTPPPGGFKHCIHCGATIPVVVVYCTKCGRRQQ